jgi:small subunit ribosomal protein S18
MSPSRDRGERGERGGRRFFTPPPHTCNCKDIDYKNAELLRRYISEAGKIRPRRQTGLCAKCQRKLAREVKRARHLALLPFTGEALR